MKMNGKKSGIVFYKIGLKDNIVIGRNINGYVINDCFKHQYNHLNPLKMLTSEVICGIL